MTFTLCRHGWSLESFNPLVQSIKRFHFYLIVLQSRVFNVWSDITKASFEYKRVLMHTTRTILCTLTHVLALIDVIL